MTDEEKQSLKIRLGKRLSTDRPEVMEIVKEEIDKTEPPIQVVLRARDDAELEQLKTAWRKGEINFTPIVAYTARPQGEWITIDAFVVKCSVCGVESFATPFCPRCGADMRGDKNGKS